MPKKTVIKIREVLPAPEVIVALDMSLGHTGYSLVRLDTGEIRKGLIEPKKLTGMARLAWLRTQVLQLVQFGVLETPVDLDTAFKTPLDKTLVLIEDYAYNARGRATISIGELGGVIRLALWEHRIPLIEIPPTRLKKFATGKGNVQKQLILKEVYKRWNVDIDDDNVADAYALMELGRALVGKNPQPLVAFQEQVVSEVVKAVAKEEKQAA